MILSRNAFDRLARELQATVDEKRQLLVVPVVVDYDDWRGTVAAGFPYEDDGSRVRVGEYAVEATVLEVDDALEGADVPEPGDVFDPIGEIDIRHELRGRPGWLVSERIRCYDTPEGIVLQGDEGFNRKEWIARGAHREVVLKRI